MATQTFIAGNQIVPQLYGGEIRSGEIKATQYTCRIMLKSRGRDVYLPVSHICWIGAEENYVRICTGNESHLLRETMASIEQRLDPKQFLRVHRSAIVNLRYVKELQSKRRGESVVRLENGQRIPLSRGYRARVCQVLSRCEGRPVQEPSTLTPHS